MYVINIIVMTLLIKDEQINVNGLYFMTIYFFQVCINSRALKAVTDSKEVHHGENEEFQEMGGYSGNGRIL